MEGRGEGCRHLAEDLGLRRDLRLDDLVCGDARFAGELEDDLEVRGHQGGCAVVHLPGDVWRARQCTAASEDNMLVAFYCFRCAGGLSAVACCFVLKGKFTDTKPSIVSVP